MDKPKFLTDVGDRVRIKDSVTHMYQNARVYNEAVVRARTRDNLGYPHVYVEWDKDHWAYSGEEDGWTFESHFDLVEEKMEDRQDDLLAALTKLVQSFSGGDAGENVRKVIEDEEDESDLTYEQVLKNAFNDAIKGDAFIVLVALPAKFGERELLVPHIYVHSKRDDASLMLDATMADAASQAHASLVLKLIESAKADGPTGP